MKTKYLVKYIHYKDLHKTPYDGPYYLADWSSNETDSWVNHVKHAKPATLAEAAAKVAKLQETEDIATRNGRYKDSYVFETYPVYVL
jgi:hypothetical protein